MLLFYTTLSVDLAQYFMKYFMLKFATYNKGCIELHGHISMVSAIFSDGDTFCSFAFALWMTWKNFIRQKHSFHKEFALHD